ncbi:hypothetical protein HOF92_00735, partial [bacterium]|nr:hypothetical protein [bacterium]
MIRFTVLLFLLVAPQCLAKLKGIELPTLQSISSLSSSLAASSRNLVKFEPFSTHQGIQPDENFAVLVRFRLDEDWHIYGKEEKIGTPTRLELLSDEFVVLSQVLSSSRVHEFGSGDQKIVSHWLEDGSYLLATLKLRDDLVIPPKLKLRFAIIYQPCTATTCLRKMRKEIDVPLFVGKTSRAELQSWMQEITELQTFLNPQLEPEADQSGSSPDKILEEGAWMALFMAFLWGVAASLTPCVYPMIPITVSLFSEGATQPFLRRLGGAFSYVLGIAFVYATLGVIASHTGRDLGSWLANPYVAIALALLMVLLALSMFGLFELDLPNSMKERLNSVEGTTHFTLFLMGGAMGFVAAPCVGPFAGAIIIWLVKNPGSLFFGFLLMSAFGLGLGVLFLFVALFSQSILPRSGPWMIILKQVMGYILLGMALYFLEILVPVKLAQVAWGLYILCAGALMGAFVRLAWDDPWW